MYRVVTGQVTSIQARSMGEPSLQLDKTPFGSYVLHENWFVVLLRCRPRRRSLPLTPFVDQTTHQTHWNFLLSAMRILYTQDIHSNTEQYAQFKLKHFIKLY